jgi:hypothetical protein
LTNWPRAWQRPFWRNTACDMAKRKVKGFSSEKEIKAIARERVGTVKPGKVIVPKSARKPKYPVKDGIDAGGEG